MSKYTRTIPDQPIIAAITAPAAGSAADIESLLDAAQLALVAGKTILQIDVQDVEGNGLAVYAPDGDTGAGGWLIAADADRSFPGFGLDALIESQTGATCDAVVIISPAAGV